MTLVFLMIIGGIIIGLQNNIDLWFFNELGIDVSEFGAFLICFFGSSIIGFVYLTLNMLFLQMIGNIRRIREGVGTILASK